MKEINRTITLTEITSRLSRSPFAYKPRRFRIKQPGARQCELMEVKLQENIGCVSVFIYIYY